MPRAMKVTAENLEAIIADAKTIGFNLGHIKDSLEYFGEEYDEDYYLFTDGTPARNNVTFNDMRSSDLFRNWKFATAETPNQFAEIVRI